MAPKFAGATGNICGHTAMLYWLVSRVFRKKIACLSAVAYNSHSPSILLSVCLSKKYALLHIVSYYMKEDKHKVGNKLKIIVSTTTYPYEIANIFGYRNDQRDQNMYMSFL